MKSIDSEVVLNMYEWKNTAKELMVKEENEQAARRLVY